MPPKRRKVIGEEVEFEWELLDDIYLPAIFRHGTKYVSVRIVELKLLSRFPKTIPNELRTIKKCVSLYLTAKEATILNEINLTLCKGEYGKERFTTNDIIVELDEFRQFFELVSDTIISTDAIELGLTKGGWLQVNNTVCPYVWVSNVKHLPHEVVCHAAELVEEDDTISKSTITRSQLAALNDLCKNSSKAFTFDESTKLLSLLHLKLEADPVLIELPPDKPFDHATYVDLTLDKASMYQFKARSKQLIYSYYNAVTVDKIIKEGAAAVEPSIARLATEPAPQVNKKKSRLSAGRSTKTSSAANTKLAPDNTHLSTSTLTVSSLEKRPCPSSLKVSEAEPLPTCAVNTSVVESSTSSCTVSPTASPQVPEQFIPAVPARVNQKGDGAVKDDHNREPKKTDKKTGIKSSLANCYTFGPKNLHFCAVDKSVANAKFWDVSMLPLCQSLPLGSKIDLAIMSLLDACVKMQKKVKALFQCSLDIMTRDGHHNKSGFKEARIIAADAASSNFKFWNAGSHKISIMSADIINTALVKAVCSDHPYSFKNSPDIIHYIISGVFGARTQSGATNFRFLQELMSIGCVVAGQSDYHAHFAYDLGCSRFRQLTEALKRWVSVVSANPHEISEEAFVRNTYKLYDKVYNSTSYGEFGTHFYPHNRSEMVQPLCATSQAQVTSTSQNAVQQIGPAQAQNRQPVPQSFGRTSTPPVRTRSPSHAMQHEVTTTVSVLPAPAVQPVVLPTMQFLTVPSPTVFPPAVQQPVAVMSTYTNLPSYATIPHYQTVAPQAARADWLSVPASQHPPAQPGTRCPININSQAFPSLTTGAGDVPTQQVDSSAGSDGITLTRLNGKKIPVYRNGHNTWVLVEDVQKIYFPRMNVEYFVANLERMCISSYVLSDDVSKAFQQHYGMTYEEQFELNRMMSTFAASQIIAKLQS